MKTYDEIKQKAYRLYLQSYKIDNERIADKWQSKAELLLSFVLEMDQEEVENISDAAWNEYEKGVQG